MVFIGLTWFLTVSWWYSLLWWNMQSFRTWRREWYCEGRRGERLPNSSKGKPILLIFVLIKYFRSEMPMFGSNISPKSGNNNVSYLSQTITSSCRVLSNNPELNNPYPYSVVRNGASVAKLNTGQVIWRCECECRTALMQSLQWEMHTGGMSSGQGSGCASSLCIHVVKLIVVSCPFTIARTWCIFVQLAWNYTIWNVDLKYWISGGHVLSRT